MRETSKRCLNDLHHVIVPSNGILLALLLAGFYMCSVIYFENQERVVYASVDFLCAPVLIIQIHLLS